MPLIWNGQPVPGTERVISFLDDPTLPNWAKRQKRRSQGRKRKAGEHVDGCGIHTFRAMRQPLVPYDPAAHRLRARECIRIHAGSGRAGSYHLYVDHDGQIYQCADPFVTIAYHGAANTYCVGIGITQGTRRTPRSAPDTTVTTNAVDAAAWLVETLWPLVSPADRTISFAGWKPGPMTSSGTRKIVRQRIPDDVLRRLFDLPGGIVIGHCHPGRKTHDPGEHVWARLGARPGWRQVWPEAA